MTLNRKVLLASRLTHDEITEITESRRRSRVISRTVIVVLIMVLAAFLYFWFSRAQEERIKGITLRYQLWQLRNAVWMHDVIFHTLPPDLKTLMRTEFHPESAATSSRHLMDGLERDENGRIIDPFGYPYQYDQTTGDVKSVAPCCTDW